MTDREKAPIENTPVCVCAYMWPVYIYEPKPLIPGQTRAIPMGWDPKTHAIDLPFFL